MGNNQCPMLTREQFSAYVLEIRKYLQDCSNANAAIGSFCDGYPVIQIGDSLCTAMIELLERIMHDQDESVSWYLFDAPKVDPLIQWKDDEGNTITRRITTPEELYDYLVETNFDGRLPHTRDFSRVRLHVDEETSESIAELCRESGAWGAPGTEFHT